MAKKKETKDADGFVEIPFGAFDSETIGWTYTIPEGFTAKIDGGKIVVEKKESGDENIRLGLMTIISNWNYPQELFAPRAKILAYLEKLKEFQFDYPGLYFYDGEKLHFQGNPAMEENLHCFSKKYQEEKQKEQKPAEIDEYEIIKKHITEDSLSSEVNKRLKECGWYVTDEKPAEWNEEEIRKRLDDFIEGKDTYSSCITWLKSLHPQPHWKPSEKQVGALKQWLQDKQYDGDSRYVYPLLESLVSDLQKLL